MKRIRSKIEKARSQGLFRTLEVQFNRFVPPWIFRYSKGDIYDLSIQKLKSLGAKTRPDDRLIVRCLGPDSDENARTALRKFTWNSVPIKTTCNDIGYAVYDADDPGKLLAGLWAAPESFLENNLGVRFEFTKEQAWLYCAFVHADARGRGVYKRLISFAAADLEGRGFSQLLGIVQPWNRISRMMHEKQSRGIVGRMAAVRIGSLIWVSSIGNVIVDRSLITNPEDRPATVRVGRDCWREVGAKPGNILGDWIGRARVAKPF
ncbi:GNAT family N-acetyltransferase [Mariniblastus fucicola]|uniref:Acetyltransferase (GNAT) family protein n=1 Tax=Mariniblastus fucicola TaxID=980251 RepID=A0A5B9PAN4_9BACT|nr:GNAT family N-acetyltransferase [Mariniblastus fucicola]QEG21556.1 Acetyltransferase (GNAT) family protein [Mariniblastus fucicola]